MILCDLSAYTQGLAAVYAPTMTRDNRQDLRTALTLAQESESGHVDPAIERLLQHELARIWAKIEAQPDQYTMDELEFAIFNRHRQLEKFQNETARKAVARYWNSKSAS